MINLFKDVYPYNNGKSIPPNWYYLRRRYMEILHDLIYYYRTRTYKVKTNHLLANILNNILPPLEYTDLRFVEVCKARAPYVSNVFEMSSAINYGKSHHGVFFSKEDDEILIFDDSDFNVRYNAFNWENVSPIKILKTPISNLDLMLANGRDSNDEHGLYVIKINITLLAFMYKCFQRSGKSTDVSYPRFIHMYILPNMLYDQFDHALLNRTMRLFYKENTGKALMRHAITLSNLETDVDKMLTLQLKDLQKRSTKYDTVLKNLVSISKEDMHEFLLLGSYIPTRQQEFVYMVSRLEIFKFLLDLEGIKGRRYNSDTIYKMGHELKSLKLDDNFHIRDLHPHTEKKLQYYIDEILKCC